MPNRTTLRATALSVTLLCLAAGIASAQETTTIEFKNGEVLAVEGNMLIVEGAEGVRAIHVPDDFRFDMDGRKLSVHQLEPGMILSAIIRTTQKPLPVTKTEVRQGEVVHTIGATVVVRTEDGELKKFTAKQLKDMNIVMHKAGKPASIYDLRKGDKVSATIVTELPPVTMTERDLKVFVENPPPEEVAVIEEVEEVVEEPVVVAVLPATAGPLPLIGLLGVLSLGLAAGLTAARRLRRRR